MERQIFFSHGTRHSRGVCILLEPGAKYKVEYLFSNETGRIALISTQLNGMKISLCNIYDPNSHSEQPEFLQHLNNCIIDKTELINFIIGGANGIAH